MGLRLDALTAGRRPNTMPMTMENTTAMRIAGILMAVGVIAAAKERNALHMVDLAELLPRFLGDRVNAGGHAVILHLIRIIVLIELHNDGVVARADKAFLDLLVRAFDRGYDRDD